MSSKFPILLCSIIATLTVSAASADDWTATRLRGGVFAWSDGQWVQLGRGSVVPDDRIIRSDASGHATFARGAETIELGSGTTVQISDHAGFTTVFNHEGSVGIDAEVRNVQHFAVQTQYLAAVVKGTAFTVDTNNSGTTVEVTRGAVEVDDQVHDTSPVLVPAGSMISSSESPITVENIAPLVATEAVLTAGDAQGPAVSESSNSEPASVSSLSDNTSSGSAEGSTSTVNTSPGTGDTNPEVVSPEVTPPSTSTIVSPDGTTPETVPPTTPNVPTVETPAVDTPAVDAPTAPTNSEPDTGDDKKPKKPRKPKKDDD